MLTRITELCEKEIINLRDGSKLGNVSDVEIESTTGNLTAIIVSPKQKLFGFSNKGDEIRINLNQIQVIGDDTILVDVDSAVHPQRKVTQNKISTIFRDG